LVKAFRNLPGVELSHVDNLNLLQLAPGGHLGRFIVWTKSAFSKLNDNWGSLTRESKHKKGYFLPRAHMRNSDLTRLINSDEIQSKLRPAVKEVKRARLHKNPLSNLGVLVRLNPYALAHRRAELIHEERRKVAKAKALEAARKNLKPEKTREEKEEAAFEISHRERKRINYNRIVNDSLYVAKHDGRSEEQEAKRLAAIQKAAEAIAAKKFIIKVTKAAAEPVEPVAAEPAKKEVKKKKEKKDEKKEEKKDDKKKDEKKKK